MPIFFLNEYGFNNYRKPDTQSLAIRVICSLLLHMVIFGEVKQSMRVMRYLKHSKSSDRKFLNVLLCSMQIIAPLEAEIVL